VGKNIPKDKKIIACDDTQTNRMLFRLDKTISEAKQ